MALTITSNPYNAAILQRDGPVYRYDLASP